MEANVSYICNWKKGVAIFETVEASEKDTLDVWKE